MAAAGVAAILDDVPILLPLLTPGEGAAAGLAELVGMGRGALGFGLAVRHGAGVLRWHLVEEFYDERPGRLELTQTMMRFS